MRFVTRGPLPVITVDRQTLLNPALSPTSRLLYAVLLASLDGDISLDTVASLVGVSDADALNSYLGELAAAGAVDMTDHGDGPSITVHELPEIPAQQSHRCAPCTNCGGCSCFYMKGICTRSSGTRWTSTTVRCAEILSRDDSGWSGGSGAVGRPSGRPTAGAMRRRGEAGLRCAASIPPVRDRRGHGRSRWGTRGIPRRRRRP